MIFKYFGTVRNGYGSVGRRSVSFSDAQFFKKIAFAIFVEKCLKRVGTERVGTERVGRVGNPLGRQSLL